jgi:hypothetical protein
MESITEIQIRNDLLLLFHKMLRRNFKQFPQMIKLQKLRCPWNRLDSRPVQVLPNCQALA